MPCRAVLTLLPQTVDEMRVAMKKMIKQVQHSTESKVKQITDSTKRLLEENRRRGLLPLFFLVARSPGLRGLSSHAHALFRGLVCLCACVCVLCTPTATEKVEAVKGAVKSLSDSKRAEEEKNRHLEGLAPRFLCCSFFFSSCC